MAEIEISAPYVPEKDWNIWRHDPKYVWDRNSENKRTFACRICTTNDYYEWQSWGWYFLVFIAHCIIEFGFTNLTKHFGVYLSSVTICMVLLGLLHPFCLVVREDTEGGTSIDNTIRRERWLEFWSRRNSIEKPPSSIAWIIFTLPRRISIISWVLCINRTIKRWYTVEKGGPFR
jgi:hypothetical protein